MNVAHEATTHSHAGISLAAPQNPEVTPPTSSQPKPPARCSLSSQPACLGWRFGHANGQGSVKMTDVRTYRRTGRPSLHTCRVVGVLVHGFWFMGSGSWVMAHRFWFAGSSPTSGPGVHTPGVRLESGTPCDTTERAACELCRFVRHHNAPWTRSRREVPGAARRRCPVARP